MNRAPDCDTCLAWDKHENLELGYCRRHAPNAQHVSEDNGGIILTIWPETEGKGDGCFDHVGILPDSEQLNSRRLTTLETKPIGVRFVQDWRILDA